MARDEPIVIESGSDTEEEELDLLQWERDRVASKRRRGKDGQHNAGITTENGSKAAAYISQMPQASTSSHDPSPSNIAAQSVPPPLMIKENPQSGASISHGGEIGGIPMTLPSLDGLALGLGGMIDRKAMERERLQRQRQRRRAQGKDSESEEELEGSHGLRASSAGQPPSSAASSSLFKGQSAGDGSVTSSGSNYKSRTYTSEVSARPRRATGRMYELQDLSQGPERESISNSSGGRQASAMSGLGGSVGSKPALRRILAGDRFWEGTVKRSWSRFTQDGVPFSDLILPSTRHNAANLTHAIIASYDIDFDWLYTILPSKDSAQPGRRALPGPELTFLVSERAGLPVGTHAGLYPGWFFHVRKALRKEEFCRQHIKLFILFYPDRMRLGILTGNMTERDWSTLEDAAYLQDFRCLPGESRDTESDVYKQLCMILSSLGLSSSNNAGFRALSRYDMSSGPTIIASIATDGPITGWSNVSKVGVGRLAVKSKDLLGEPILAGGLQLEAQGSSMGRYSSRWLQMFHLAASGLIAPLPTSMNASNATRRYQTMIGQSDREWPPIKVVFPTRDFVLREASGGRGSGGCHFGKAGEAFEKFSSICYQARGARLPGLLMHQKAILAIKPGISLHDASSASDGPIDSTGILSSSSVQQVERHEGRSTDEDKDEIIGWTYLGSANFTKAAWGNLSAPSKSGPSSHCTPDHSSSRTAVQLTANNWELGVLFPLRRSDLSPEADLSTNARSAICWERPLRPYRPHGRGGSGDVPWVADGEEAGE